MGTQITVGQLIEKRIIMMISKEMVMYIGIMSKISRSTPVCIYYYYHTSTAIHHASSVLSSWKNRVMQYERCHDVDKIYSCRNRPHLLILNNNATCVSCLFSSLRLSTARSNPSQSTSSHCKKNQSSWPNQTNVSEKKYEAIKIMHKRVQQRLK